MRHGLVGLLMIGPQRRVRLAIGLALGLASASNGSASPEIAPKVPVIGHALDVVVPVGTKTFAGGLPPCTQVEVYYGDRMASAGRVTTEPVSNTTAALLRVRSSAIVDDPAVTIYLHMGCSSIVSRRFDLVSERAQSVAAPAAGIVPDGSAAPVAPAALEVAAPPHNTPTRPPTRPSTRTPWSTAAQAPAAGAVRPTLATEQANGLPSKVVALQPTVPLVAVGADRDMNMPLLRMSRQLALGEPATGEQRARSADLRRAIMGAPEDIVQERLQHQAVGHKLQHATQVVKDREAALATLERQLDNARGRRFTDPMVYSLVGLLLLTAGAWLYTLRRNRASLGTARWQLHDENDSEIFFNSGPRPNRAAVVQGPEASMHVPARTETLTRGEEPSSTTGQDPGPDEEWSTQTGPVRDQADDLIDVQQEADFFVAIGQPESAVTLINNHIRSTVSPSSVLWVKLLNLHHQMGQTAHYDEVRERLLQTFDLQAPSFQNYPGGLDQLESHVSGDLSPRA